MVVNSSLTSYEVFLHTTWPWFLNIIDQTGIGGGQRFMPLLVLAVQLGDAL